MRLNPCAFVAVLGICADVSLSAQGADSAAVPVSPVHVGSTRAKAFPTDSVLRSRKLGRIVTIDHTPMGDVRETDLVFAPTAFYAPETGFGGGAGLVLSRTVGDHLADQRPSTFQGALQFTQEQQFTVNTTGDIWTRHDKYRFTYEAIYSHFPQLFFGIGPSTPAEGERKSRGPPTPSLLVLRRSA